MPKRVVQVRLPADTPLAMPSPAVPPLRTATVEWSPLSDFLWQVFISTNELVRFADQKAGVTIVFASTLLGLYQSNGIFNDLLTRSRSTWSAQSVLATLGTFLLTLSIACAVWSIRPRRQGVNVPGFVYWSSIVAHGTPEQFWSELHARTPAELAQHASHSLYNVSLICKEKYAWVSRSMVAAIAGGVMSALLLLPR